MIRIIVSLAFVSLNSIAFGQQVHQVPTKVERVTVFLSGAEVQRSATINVKKGLNELRFEGISVTADSKSIQFETAETADLLSIVMERDFLSTGQRNEKITKIKDSIDLFELEIQNINNERGGLEAEKQLLFDNQKLGGDNVKLTVSEIRDAADFYRKRIGSINTQTTELNRATKKIDQQLMKLRNQLYEYNYRENVKNQVIVVLIEVDEPKTIQTKLSYIVSNSGWAPSYDLIAEDLSGKIELKYKAKVFNNTGNDWNTVDISLSTGDPKLNASIPNLNPWHLNAASFSSNQQLNKSLYSVPQAQSRVNTYQGVEDISKFKDSEGRLQNLNTGDFNEILAPTIAMELIEISELVTEFDVDKKYTIPSDSKPYIVEITTYNLDAEFSHVSVPKVDKDAFLLAKIAGWERLDLVPGPSNVYFAQTYVGESYINTRNVEDTLGLSFGRDGKILVTRKKSEEFSNKKVIGAWKRDTYTYEIIVKNNRTRKVAIEIKDQVPVSQDSDITVSVNNISGATQDEITGELAWNLNLEPGESKKLTISFEIKYPKNKNVNVKTYRTISAPSF